jgi:hypothetical protein
MVTQTSKHRCTPLFSDEDNDLSALLWRSDRGGYVRRSKKYKREDGKWGTKPSYAHRIVLSRVLGRALSPGELCDHANGNKLDNRRENLRLATHAQNSQNVRRYGRRGVTLHRQTGKWQAGVNFSGKFYYCGLHDSPEMAEAAAAAKRRELGFFGEPQERATA